MINLALDLETLPTEDPAVIAAITEGVKPPGNLKKSDTIARWEDEDKPGAVEEAIRKTALDGTYGRILAIGYAVNDKDTVCHIGEEITILEAFMADLRAVSKFKNYEGGVAQTILFIGHNIAAFDLRFLWQRMVIHGIKPTDELLAAMKARPWDRLIADTLLLWNPDRERRISLAKLCKILGVEKNDPVDGSQVAQLWKDGKLDEIKEHCRSDVAAVREVHRRLTFHKAA